MIQLSLSASQLQARTIARQHRHTSMLSLGTGPVLGLVRRLALRRWGILVEVTTLTGRAIGAGAICGLSTGRTGLVLITLLRERLEGEVVVVLVVLGCDALVLLVEEGHEVGVVQSMVGGSSSGRCGRRKVPEIVMLIVVGLHCYRVWGRGGDVGQRGGGES